MSRLLLMGMNHTTAPVALRERLAPDALRRQDVLRKFHALYPEAEAVILSTCNRLELYTARAVHGYPRPEQMLAFLCQQGGLSPDELLPHLYQKLGREVAGHLFRVASSLDSMVVGETEILGQVRDAYDESQQVGMCGSGLNPLFQKALATGKEVMAGSGISDGKLSVASVAIDYARQIFERFDDKVVLAIGAGDMGLVVLEHLHRLNPGKLLVCTRDVTKAQDVAGRYGAEAVPFELLAEHLLKADIVVSATRAAHPVVTRGLLAPVIARRGGRPIFMIDIALPRDIEPAVADLDHVHLYNLDDLQRVVTRTHGRRAEALGRAEQIVTAAVSEFVDWQQSRALGPIIEQLYAHCHAIAKEEAQRGGVTEDAARRIVNKLLDGPVRKLRRSGAPLPPGDHYLQAVKTLFELDAPAGDEDEV